MTNEAWEAQLKALIEGYRAAAASGDQRGLLVAADALMVSVLKRIAEQEKIDEEEFRGLVMTMVGAVHVLISRDLNDVHRMFGL